MNIGQVIAQNRKSKGLSQIDVAKELGRFDIHVGNAAISAWEKGINMPTANQFLALCQILEINDIYTEFIGENPNDPFSSRVICMQADATASPPLGIGSFDVIVSNPPYIKSGEIQTLDRSVRDYEPIWALDGGKDGLRFYKAIIKYWKSLLRPEGALIFEVGEGQADDVCDMLMAAGFASCQVRKDARGVERVVIGRM